MRHDYGVRTSAMGHIAECSCGWRQQHTRHVAAQLAALDHAGVEAITIETRNEYRRRHFVATSDGMDEMFPGEGYR